MSLSTTSPTARRVSLIAASAVIVLVFGWFLLGWATNSPARANVRALHDTEASTRDEAARSLVGVARTPWEFSDIVDALIKAQDDESPNVRTSAINSLVANFVQIRKRGADSPLAAAAAERLPDAKASLARALRDKDDTVRGLAVVGMATLMGGAGEPLPRDVWVCLEDQAEFVRSSAVGTLKEFKTGVDAAVPALLRQYERQTGNTHAAFAQALNEIKPTAASLPALSKAMTSPSREQRHLAATLLGRIGADATPAVPGLIALLKEEFRSQLPAEALKPSSGYSDPGSAAALALGQIASQSKSDVVGPVVATLKGALSCGEKPRIAAVAGALAQLGPKAADALPTLRAELSHPRWAKSFDGSVANALARISKGTPEQAGIITLLGESWRTADRRREPGLASALKSLGPDAIAAYPALKTWTAPEEILVDAE